MKITHTILTLLAAGFLGHNAFGDNGTNPLSLAVTQDGHGGSHFAYYQTNPARDMTTVALYTSSGGLVVTPLPARDRPLTDDGQTRFVIGTNQHGQANCAYIPLDSHFGQANQ